MNSKTIANGILRALGIILGIFLLGYFLYAIQSVIVYIIIAGILSLIARPIILFLRRKLKFPNTLCCCFYNGFNVKFTNRYHFIVYSFSSRTRKKFITC